MRLDRIDVCHRRWYSCHVGIIPAVMAGPLPHETQQVGGRLRIPSLWSCDRGKMPNAVSADGQSADVPGESLAQPCMICQNEMVESSEQREA